MNKIYRRIWSSARQCWIVASELSTPRGKASRTVGTAALAVVLMTCLPGASATEADDEDPAFDWSRVSARGFITHAPDAGFIAPTSSILYQTVYQNSITTDSSYRNSTVQGDHMLVLGSRSRLVGDNSVGFGNRIYSEGSHNTAVGVEAMVSGGGYGTAAGAKSWADGVGATAIGHNARAHSENSIALGSGALTNSSKAGISRIAIGGDAYAGTSGWTGAIALGGKSRAEYDALAIGYEAKAYSSGSIALGRGSIANEGNTVSVGNSTTKRRVVNVADGVLSSSSTDAVTGKQLHATNQNVTTALNTANTAKATADRALASSGLVSQTSSSSAIRMGAQNTGTVIDVANQSGAKRRIQNLANGTLSSTSTDAVTGQQLNATNQGVTAATNTANAAQTTAGAAKTAADSALAQATTLGGLVGQVSATGNVRLGAENSGTVLDVRNKANANRKISGIADATLSGTSTEAVTGRQLNTTNTNVTAAQNTATAAQTAAGAAKTTADSALAQATTLGGLVGQVSATGNVRLGAENSGTVLDVRNKANANRRISGVADATLSTTSTEAVTGRQLNTTNTNVTAAQNTANAAQTTASAAKTTADSALAQTTTLGGLVGQVSATGNMRLGAENGGTVLDVRNKANANRRISGIADATLSATSTEAVTGRQLNTTNTNVTAAQNAANAAQTTAGAAKTTADSALAQATTLGGLVGQVSATGSVRLGAENSGTVLDVSNKAGGKRRISNVADAVLSATSSDAVSGQQLFATNETARVQGQALSSHAAQLTAHAGRIDDNREGLDRLREEFEAFNPDLEGVVKFSDDRSLVEMGGARVTGIADGDISSATSTDAVTGGQLYATNLEVGSIKEQQKYVAVGGGGDQGAARAGLVGVALGDSAEASLDSEGAVAVGSYAVARGKNSVALGRAAYVTSSAEDGFALGVRSLVEETNGLAIGAAAAVKKGAAHGVAIGSDSIATEAMTTSFGNEALQRRLVNIARGRGVNDATSIGQLSESLAVLGGGARLDLAGNVIAPTYTMQGGTQRSVADALNVLDSATTKTGTRVGVIENQLRSIFDDTVSARADGVGKLTLAGAQGMVLTNLADGRLAPGSRDAVTGNQLYAAKQEIARNKSEIDQMKEQRDERLGSVRQGPIDFAGSRVTGLAEGDISSATSTDAVTGGQLFTTNGKLAELESSQRFMAVGSAGPGVSAKAGLVGVALGDSAVGVGEGAVALGSFSRAGGKNSIALGRAAHVMESAEDGFAVGVRSVVSAEKGIAIGAASTVQSGATYSVAIGSGSIAKEALTVSFGEGVLQRRLVNIANGRNLSDATTVAQLNETLRSIGGGARIDANGNIVGPSFNLQGRSHATLGDALQSLDGAVTSTGSRMDRVEGQLRSVFQDTPSSRADGIGQLTLAGAQGMVISNVANGLIAAGSRDAVNGGQLHAMQQQLNGRVDGLESRLDARSQRLASAETPLTPPPAAEQPPVAETGDAPKVASSEGGGQPAGSSKKKDEPAPKAQVDTAELEKMLARANEYTDGAISNVERRLDKMDKRFNRMAAMGSAQSAMAMNTAGLNTYNRLGAGVGYSEGESAMAVGYQRVLNDKGSATFSLNGAFTNSGERTVGVGVGIGW
ncbi:TPA: YadA-like family protein [Stenotrophomonas maltophilia]|nr:YadA-like family protein [Stenotrophomonas maltophilia]HDS1025999.1 YadA-like family protein [Stenotrophomonas maltophilia]HDS1031624.1 YadA-like family protein [Stenotrophomonas maltophilia]HDS1035101.1 YadA-like family protein [Stenotrophomonas maltophilia]